MRNRIPGAVLCSVGICRVTSGLEGYAYLEDDDLQDGDDEPGKVIHVRISMLNILFRVTERPSFGLDIIVPWGDAEIGRSVIRSF